MVDVLMIHLVLEYMLQPESILALKKSPTAKGLLVLLAHVAVPALACLALGLMTPVQAGLVVVLHAVFDGAIGTRLVVFTRVHSIYRAMSSQYEEWPVQVQALEFALASSSERQWYLVAHLLAIYTGMNLGALL